MESIAELQRPVVIRRRLKELLAKTRSPNQRNVWQALADYVNADLLESGQIEAAGRIWGLVGLATEEISAHAEITEESFEASFLQLLRRYQPELRDVLRWLCEPGKHGNLGNKATRFLKEHTEGIRYQYDPFEFDQTSEAGAPLFFHRDVVFSPTIMGPISQFLIGRIVEYQDGPLDLSVRSRRKAIPLRLCYRKECGRFKLPKRQKERCYCSDRCKSIVNQKPRAHKAAAMREYRRLKKRGVGAWRKGRRRTTTR